MSGRILYIEEHDNDEDPCICSDCGWKGKFGDLDPVTDGALNAGDPSYAGRCPDCTSVAYLDRPLDRATNALRRLVRVLDHGYPTGDANLYDAIAGLQSALAEVRPEFAFTLDVVTRGQA